ncbi:jg17930 [Pararge aegeria aegeria]|uniref:Jg17930 protein n=1 Tax=Pararge aegeria aegeria TaxID=348720 RepID=A0A8S4S7E0_9NEOP|nr:jg17930 [Pararge aegeria aegeria]
MRDSNIVTIYKGKGDSGDGNSYRGISLLSIVGKVFWRVVLGRLQRLADCVYPEAQCGFRSRRSTIDMVFTVRQLQKCREQRTSLLVAFVDLNKAFDSISRGGLFTALERIGCPPKLLRFIMSFHEDTIGVVVFNGITSDPFPIRRGVRQGRVLAPTLFGILFSLILCETFGRDQHGIHLHTRSDGKLFKISFLKTKRNRESLFIDRLLFADSSILKLQRMLDNFSPACSLFSMSINPIKTVVSQDVLAIE